MPEIPLKTPKLYRVNDVEAFRAGCHRDGQCYSVDDLREIVTNFHRLSDPADPHRELTPTFCLGHAEPGSDADPLAELLEDTGALRAGRVCGLRLRGDVLLADIDELLPEIARLIAQKRITKVSVEVYDDYTDSQGRQHGHVLRRIAGLGAELPQVKGLADIPQPVMAYAGRGGQRVVRLLHHVRPAPPRVYRGLGGSLRWRDAGGVEHFADAATVRRYAWTQFRTRRGTTGAQDERGRRLYGARAQAALARQTQQARTGAAAAAARSAGQQLRQARIAETAAAGRGHQPGVRAAQRRQQQAQTRATAAVGAAQASAARGLPAQQTAAAQQLERQQATSPRNPVSADARRAAAAVVYESVPPGERFARAMTVGLLRPTAGSIEDLERRLARVQRVERRTTDPRVRKTAGRRRRQLLHRLQQLGAPGPFQRAIRRVGEYLRGLVPGFAEGRTPGPHTRRALRRYLARQGIAAFSWQAAQSRTGRVKAVWAGPGRRPPIYGDRATAALAAQARLSAAPRTDPAPASKADEQPWRSGKVETGRVYNAPVAELKVDPQRFQFKLNTDKSGVTDELKSVKTWNPDFAGVLSVWRDPGDGKTYVVNGHHRHELATRLGARDVAIRYVTAGSAQEARAVGALINIAEGRGTAVDAAKFMRDTGVGPEEIERRGVSMRGRVAADAVTLTALNDRLFDRVARGTLDPSRALLVARHLKDHDLQDQLFRVVDSAEKKGKDISGRVLEEMAREMAHTPTRTRREEGLFGVEESTESLFLQRNELKAHVRAELAKEVNDWHAVASKRRAKRVTGAGNVLDVEANARIAQDTERIKNVYDTLVNRKGAVSDAINQAAADLASAKSKREKDAIQQRAIEAVREAVQREAGVGAAVARGPGPGSSGGAAAGAAQPAGAPAPATPDAGRGAAAAAGVTPPRPAPKATPAAPTPAPTVTPHVAAALQLAHRLGDEPGRPFAGALTQHVATLERLQPPVLAAIARQLGHAGTIAGKEEALMVIHDLLERRVRAARDNPARLHSELRRYSCCGSCGAAERYAHLPRVAAALKRRCGGGPVAKHCQSNPNFGGKPTPGPCPENAPEERRPHGDDLMLQKAALVASRVPRALALAGTGILQSGRMAGHLLGLDHVAAATRDARAMGLPLAPALGVLAGIPRAVAGITPEGQWRPSESLPVRLAKAPYHIGRGVLRGLRYLFGRGTMASHGLHPLRGAIAPHAEGLSPRVRAALERYTRHFNDKKGQLMKKPIPARVRRFAERAIADREVSLVLGYCRRFAEQLTKAGSTPGRVVTAYRHARRRNPRLSAAEFLGNHR